MDKTEKAKLGGVNKEICQTIVNMVDYAEDSIVSRTILDKSTGTITIFAFDKGQRLSEHTSPYDAVIQVLDGKAQVTINGRKNEIAAGQLIVMPANASHSVAAEVKFKMMLIMIRS